MYFIVGDVEKKAKFIFGSWLSGWVAPGDTAIPGMISLKDGDLLQSSVLAQSPNRDLDYRAPTIQQKLRCPPTSPKPTSPKPTSPKPTSPKPTSPKPTSPKPTSPKPTSPKPTSPKPTSPKSTSPKPTSPKPTSPKPTSPKPISPKPTSPKLLSTCFDIRYWIFDEKNYSSSHSHHFCSSLNHANFSPITPRQFIFANHIARVEFCQKNFTQPTPTSPPQKIDFFTNSQSLNPANFLPNTPRQFIFYNPIARVEFCQKNFTQPFCMVLPLQKFRKAKMKHKNAKKSLLFYYIIIIIGILNFKFSWINVNVRHTYRVPLNQVTKGLWALLGICLREINFFNADLKRSSDSSGDGMSSGREFQTTGPETRKLLGPKRRVLLRGTIRSPRRADRRWALAPTSRTELQLQLRYIGPWSWRAL